MHIVTATDKDSFFYKSEMQRFCNALKSLFRQRWTYSLKNLPVQGLDTYCRRFYLTALDILNKNLFYFLEFCTFSDVRYLRFLVGPKWKLKYLETSYFVKAVTLIFAYLTRNQIASGEFNSIKIQIISRLTPGWLHEWIFNDWESSTQFSMAFL